MKPQAVYASVLLTLSKLRCVLVSAFADLVRIQGSASGEMITLMQSGATFQAALMIDGSENLTRTRNSGGQFTGPFAFSLHFANVAPIFGLTTPQGGSLTIQSFSSIINGTVTGSAVPEPSTFALLGFGVAGLAFATYRQRKVASAV